MRLGRYLKLPGSLTSWRLNEDNALNTLSWLRLCSYARRTDRSVSQKVGGRQRIVQQRLLGKSRCLQYVRHERKRLCGRHIPYAVNAYRGEYMMRYSCEIAVEDVPPRRSISPRSSSSHCSRISWILKVLKKAFYPRFTHGFRIILTQYENLLKF